MASDKPGALQTSYEGFVVVASDELQTMIISLRFRRAPSERTLPGYSSRSTVAAMFGISRNL
jgi:hypothetical protein